MPGHGNFWLGTVEVVLMEEKKYTIQENSKMEGDMVSGSITIEYHGLSREEKAILENRILVCVDLPKTVMIPTNSFDSANSYIRKRKLIFGAWQIKFFNEAQSGMTSPEICQAFRKKFHGAPDISDTKIYEEYCTRKGDPAGITTSTAPLSSSSPPPLPPPKKPDPEKPVPIFDTGDHVRYVHANPAHPPKIGEVTALGKDKMMVQFGINDKKWVFKHDYEIVEKKVKTDGEET